jgi:hypothetical protein
MGRLICQSSSLQIRLGWNRFALWINFGCFKKNAGIFQAKLARKSPTIGVFCGAISGARKKLLHVGQSLIQSRIVGLFPYRRTNDANTCLP